MAWHGRIPGTPLVVDNFSRKAVAHSSASGHAQAAGLAAAAQAADAPSRDGPKEEFYFCTHAHTDHTVGLKAHWDLGTIYCSAITKALLLQKFPGGTLDRRIIALEMDQPHTIVMQKGTHHEQDTYVVPGGADAHEEGRSRKRKATAAASAADVPSASSIFRADTFTVTLFSSNHCPGSVMFAFHSHAWGTVLHTGDFRYDPTAFHSAALHALVRQVDLLYFDATFFAQECSFPSKHQAIREISQAIRQVQEKHAKDRTNTYEGKPDKPARHHPAESAGKRSAEAAAAAVSTCPPALDWRVYICCGGLGSEDILASLSLEFDQPFFVDETDPLLKKRAAQLQLLARMSGDDQSRIVTDPALANRTHLHLAPGCDFANWSRMVKFKRHEEKKRYRAQEAAKRAELHASTTHSYTIASAAATAAAASAAASNPFASSAPSHTLFIQPSTLWFISNQRAVSSCAMNLLPLGSSYLTSGRARFTRAEEQLLDYSQAAANAPTQMAVRSDDRWGVTHILYSMHSDAREIVEFIRFIRPRQVAPINTPCWMTTERNQTTAYASLSQGQSPAGSSSMLAASTVQQALGPANAEVTQYVERLLRLMKVPAEDMPIVRSTTFAPTPRQNALARQQRDLMQQQVQRRREWDARQAQSQSTESTGEDSSLMRDAPGDGAPRRCQSSPVKAGGAFHSRHPGGPRVKLAHPISPLDALGQGKLGSRWVLPRATSDVLDHLPARSNLLRVPFNPRECSALRIHLERDLSAVTRVELRRRFEALGCPVTEWTTAESLSYVPGGGGAADSTPDDSGGVRPMDISGGGDSISNAARPPTNSTTESMATGQQAHRIAPPAAAAAAAASSSSIPVPSSTGISSDTTFVVLSLDRVATQKLLLPAVIREVEAMSSAADESADASARQAASARDWTTKPLFICGTDLLLWLEGMNGRSAPPADESAAGGGLVESSELSLRGRLDHTITWQDVCVWNSRSKFEQLRAAHVAKPVAATAAGGAAATSTAPAASSTHLAGKSIPAAAAGVRASLAPLMQTGGVITINSSNHSSVELISSSRRVIMIE